MNAFDELKLLLEGLPGVGPRQASRFAYSLIKKPDSYLRNLSECILHLKKSMRICTESYMYFYAVGNETISPIASDPSRNKTQLLIVEKDADAHHIEQLQYYTGMYFILGNTLSILEKAPETKIRIRELKAHLQANSMIEKILIGTSRSPEGDTTGIYVKKELELLYEDNEKRPKISFLGRGLSTGVELEYIDKDTFIDSLSGLLE